jgi:4-methyl-5(b-hydroxyethyl)-thiazole monophosphate biosynthesis
MKNVLLLFCQGTEIFEAGAFYDVLGWSGSNGFEEVRVTTTAPTGHVTCTFGLKVTVDLRLAEVVPEHYDALAVPGGFEEFGFYEDAYSVPVQSLIARFAELNKPIASICEATRRLRGHRGR